MKHKILLFIIFFSQSCLSSDNNSFNDIVKKIVQAYKLKNGCMMAKLMYKFSKEFNIPLKMSFKEEDQKFVQLLKSSLNSLLKNAVMKNDIEKIEGYIQIGADINARFEHSRTLLMLAAKNNCKEAIDKLLSYEDLFDADSEKQHLCRCDFGYTAFHYAATSNIENPEIIESLLKRLYINSTTRKGITPLHLAAYCGHFAIVKVLVQNCANYQFRTNLGKTPLDFAREKGHKEIVEYLSSLN